MTLFQNQSCNPIEDTAWTMVHRWEYVAWIISRSFLFPHFHHFLTLVVINLGLISPWNFLPKLLLPTSILPCNFILGLPIFTAEDYFESCKMVFIFLLSKTSSNWGLWNLHPYTVEGVHYVTDRLGDFYHCSQCFCNQLLLFSFRRSVLYLLLSTQADYYQFSGHSKLFF